MLGCTESPVLSNSGLSPLKYQSNRGPTSSWSSAMKPSTDTTACITTVLIRALPASPAYPCLGPAPNVARSRSGRPQPLALLRIEALRWTAQEIEMISRLNVASIYVLDKEEALDFYVNKLGLEKGSDVRQGDYRWLTIRVPGQQGTEVSLEQPGAPLHDDATAAQIRELITKGALGGLVFVTDDARELYDTLKARGVTDFTQ